MSKLNQSQKEQLKRCIIDSNIRRFTAVETQQYIREHMSVEIGLDYIWHLCSDLKSETKKTLDILRKDRFAYLDELVFDRIRELKLMQNYMFRIVDTSDNDETKIKAAAQSHSITKELTYYYSQLLNVTSLHKDLTFANDTASPSSSSTSESDGNI